MVPPSFRRFLDEQQAVDGHAPLSEAKEGVLGDPQHMMVIMEGDEVMALGAVRAYETINETERMALETVVPPSMRFAEFEDRVVAETIALIPDQMPYTAWSRRQSLDSALERRGMTVVRSLAEMAISLPISSGRRSEGDTISVRAFTGTDTDALIRINRAAFGDHPEAATLDREELGGLMEKPWFDPSGVLLSESDGEVTGFCWTKVHPTGEGEVYRIGVDPRHRGQGLGRRLTLAGYDYLFERQGCTTGFLWVDEANDAAVAMYTGIGLSVRSRNREFALAQT